MGIKKQGFSDNIFSSFEHKAKINPGNKNDGILLKEIEEITGKISFECEGIEPRLFGERKVEAGDLRPDEMAENEYDWLSQANETEDGFVCVSNIVNKEG